MPFDPRNILVIDFGQLGDVVLSLPALKAIRERFPQARITVAVGKSGGQIIEMSGYADATIVVDRVALRDGATLVSIGKIIKLVLDVRKTKYDFVIDLHSLSETNILGFLSGAPKRLYSHRPGRSLEILANFDPKPPREDKKLHATKRYLDVLKPLGILEVSSEPRLRTDRKADLAIEKLLKKQKADSHNLLVGIFPGAGHISRRWPLERYAQLADFLLRNQRVRVMVITGPEERELVAQAKQLFPPATILVENPTIQELASLEARLSLFISNDTGPMHIAAAVGTPVLIVLDRTDPHEFIPVGNHHRIIFSKDIKQIPVDEVYKVANELLASSRTEQIFNRAENK